MDGRGRALDNIFVERHCRSGKHEDVYLKDYATLPELLLGLTEYKVGRELIRCPYIVPRTPVHVEFMLRGLNDAHNEWTLVCLAWNLNAWPYCVKTGEIERKATKITKITANSAPKKANNAIFLSFASQVRQAARNLPGIIWIFAAPSAHRCARCCAPALFAAGWYPSAGLSYRPI